MSSWEPRAELNGQLTGRSREQQLETEPGLGSFSQELCVCGLACEITLHGPGGFGSDCLEQDIVFPPQGQVAAQCPRFAVP